MSVLLASPSASGFLAAFASLSTRISTRHMNINATTLDS